MNICRHIDPVIKLAEAEGNTILSITKSELMNNVIWMNNQLSKPLRDKLMLEMKSLDYKGTKDMPHDPATEYFVCDECKSVVIFPLQTAK